MNLMNKIFRAIVLFFSIISLSLYSQENNNVDELYSARLEIAETLFPGNNAEWNKLKAAFIKVRKELFIDENYRSVAYKNMPIPVKGGLIQPSPEMIATILKEAKINLLNRVLVIGRNTQYLDSLLSQLTVNLYVSDPTATFSSESTIKAKSNMNYLGWVEAGPFNTIILFGAVDEIPHSLVSQLTVNGKIIAPISYNSGNQILMSATKLETGFELKSIGESYIHQLQ